MGDMPANKLRSPTHMSDYLNRNRSKLSLTRDDDDPNRISMDLNSKPSMGIFGLSPMFTTEVSTGLQSQADNFSERTVYSRRLRNKASQKLFKSKDIHRLRNKISAILSETFSIQVAR